MKKVYGGMILGSVPFIKEALNRLEDELLLRTDVLKKHPKSDEGGPLLWTSFASPSTFSMSILWKSILNLNRP